MVRGKTRSLGRSRLPVLVAGLVDVISGGGSGDALSRAVALPSGGDLAGIGRTRCDRCVDRRDRAGYDFARMFGF